MLSTKKIFQAYLTFFTILNSAFVIQKDLEVEIPMSAEEEAELMKGMEPAEVIAKCKQGAKTKYGGSSEDPSLAAKILNELTACIKNTMSRFLKAKDEEIKFEKQLREQISHNLENYTCIDADLESTPDVEERQWTSDRDGVTRVVHVKHERSAR